MSKKNGHVAIEKVAEPAVAESVAAAPVFVLTILYDAKLGKVNVNVQSLTEGLTFDLAYHALNMAREAIRTQELQAVQNAQKEKPLT